MVQSLVVITAHLSAALLASSSWLAVEPVVTNSCCAQHPSSTTVSAMQSQTGLPNYTAQDPNIPRHVQERQSKVTMVKNLVATAVLVYELSHCHMLLLLFK